MAVRDTVEEVYDGRASSEWVVTSKAHLFQLITSSFPRDITSRLIFNNLETCRAVASLGELPSDSRLELEGGKLDILVRTSNVKRLSDFMMWQVRWFHILHWLALTSPRRPRTPSCISCGPCGQNSGFQTCYLSYSDGSRRCGCAVSDAESCRIVPSCAELCCMHSMSDAMQCHDLRPPPLPPPDRRPAVLRPLSRSYRLPVHPSTSDSSYPTNSQTSPSQAYRSPHCVSRTTIC
jgi:hypothetical protein